MLRWFMRRIRRFWLLLLFIVLLIPVALWITASTERGSRWLINSTLHLLPADVSIQQVDGTLLDSLTLTGIQFTAPPHQGSLKKAHLQWQPAALLKRKIHIVDLTVDGLVLDIGETESSSEPAQIPQLPMAIDFDSIRITNTEVMLQGETHGRRDYVFIYQVNKLAAVVKEQYKLFVPAAGDNPITADFYDLFRDTREEHPVSTEVGAWGGQEFVRIIGRHLQRKAIYPDEKAATGRPYEGIENLRPETKAAVDAFLVKQAASQM